MSFSDPLTIGSRTYSRIDSGKFVDTSTTVDEPRNLSIDSTIVPEGVSSFVVKTVTHENDPDGLSDEFLQVHVVVRYSKQGFTNTQISDEIASVASFLAVPDNLTRLRRGEK
jgi:hypothetical protein